MCGIAGVINWDQGLRVTERLLRDMGAHVAHRGPDGEGIWLNHHAHVRSDRPQAGFAFRRLAVIDPNERSMQPMTIGDGRLTLVFNGEIYNYRELKKRLSARQWLTDGDTEVLLAALAEWGPEITLGRLDGMFALALWDEAERTLMLARDRMGQKPLYFTVGEGSLAFASEIAALQEWPHWDRSIDDAALTHYLRYGYVLAPQTIYRGVRQLEPGTRLLFSPSARAADVKLWFSLIGGEPAEERPRRPQETRHVIERAVRRQLVSDVPLGVFLSGGIDSSIVALAAKKAGATKTFSIGFADPYYDETQYAEAVARHLGTEHHTFRVTPDIANDLPKLAAVFGEPFADSSALPTHWLSQQTRSQVTVALSGDGGDELFGGYDRYRAIAMPAAPLRALAPVGRRLERGHPKARVTRFGRLLAAVGLPRAQRYDRYVSLFDPAQAAALLGRPATSSRPRAFADLVRTCGGPVEAALAFDRVTYLPGDLLTKVDRCSMLHALEVRSPFMDADVLEYASTLRRRQLYAGGPKRLLREAFADELPDFVFKRKKMGFAVPIGQWLRGSLRDLLHDHLSAENGFCRQHFDRRAVEKLETDHASGRAEHGQRLYALLMLELWWKTAL